MQKKISKEIQLSNKYTLYICRQENLKEVSDFVANVYYNNHEFNFECNLNELVDDIQSADVSSSNDTILFYIIDNEQNLCCTARFFRKSEELPLLPIEEQFDINLNFFDKENIYEFARFASNRRMPFSIIAKLLQYMMLEIDTENSYVFASMDETLYKKFIRIKYPVYKLGKSIFYMGSDTIPIVVKPSEILAVAKGDSK